MARVGGEQDRRAGDGDGETSAVAARAPDMGPDGLQRAALDTVVHLC